MAQRSYLWLLWVLALSGLTLDLGSKYGVFAWLYPAPEWVAQATREEGFPAIYQGKWEIMPGAFQLLVQHTNDRVGTAGVLARLRGVGGELLPKVNQGALFGLGSDYAELANGIFAVVSVLAAGAIIVWSRRPATARDLPLCIALGLILAGTLGNLYDRVVFHGVRDFLYFYWIEWPVFNVADCCLVCGAGLLLLQAFWCQPACAKQESPAVALSGPVGGAN